MRNEPHWQQVDVIWDEDVHRPEQQTPLLWRDPRLPFAIPPAQGRPRQEHRADERPERREDHAEPRRKTGKQKRGRKKLRAHDFDDDER
jgi:hypothetical protein